MMLWKFFKRKKKDQKPVNTFGQDLNKLIDGELPFGWVVKFKDYYQPKDSKMTELALSIKGKNGQERIAALQTLIKYFYSYKEECKLKGECFEKYFDNMWMHCHNSRCDDFIYIVPYVFPSELKRFWFRSFP